MQTLHSDISVMNIDKEKMDVIIARLGRQKDNICVKDPRLLSHPPQAS